MAAQEMRPGPKIREIEVVEEMIPSDAAPKERPPAWNWDESTVGMRFLTGLT
jgi:hypothetical protein